MLESVYCTANVCNLGEHKKSKTQREGEIFLKYSKQILNSEYSLLQELDNSKENTRQTLRIGSIPLMAPYQITDLIVNYKKENPGCRISLVENGMGIALLMEMPVASLITLSDKVVTVDISPIISTEISIYYKKEVTLSNAAKHFIRKACDRESIS